MKRRSVMLLKCLNGKRANVSGMSACLPSAAVRPARGTRGRALALRPRVATSLPFRGTGNTIRPAPVLPVGRSRTAPQAMSGEVSARRPGTLVWSLDPAGRAPPGSSPEIPGPGFHLELPLDRSGGCRSRCCADAGRAGAGRSGSRTGSISARVSSSIRVTRRATTLPGECNRTICDPFLR